MMRRPTDLAADWPTINALLDEALALPEAERAGWLEGLPPGTRPVIATLRRLLALPAAFETGDILHTLPKMIPGPADGLGGAPEPDAHVGPWRLLREIGEGGMGSVWLAERADGQLKRQAALKLPRLSWARGLAERLARERDILATLTHPHIARLYDAGVDPHGRPWLALEYVQGRPLDEHARDKALDMKQRVQLLLQVCEAVAYAHSRLVIHRDLKPGNILVTDEGQVRLLDFGIAKLMEGHSTVHTALTAISGRALTLRYASPEQLAGEVLTTASDVYSLGVVAFELASAVSPYGHAVGDPAGDRAGNKADLEAAIERGALPLASTVTADPGSRRALRGDLDAVLARALAREPAARYPSVDALAADLRRWLDGSGVLARAVPWPVRAQRWVRRHPLPSAVVVAVVLALAGGAYAQGAVVLAMALGSGVALWQRNGARREAARARAALMRAETVKEFLASVFVNARPRSGSGGVVTAADLLHGAWQRLGRSFDAEPAVRAELGALVGASFNELGEPESARQVLLRVVDESERVLGVDHPVSLSARWRLGEALSRCGEQAEAIAVLSVLLQRLARLAPAHAALHVSALRSAAMSAGLAGQVDEAVRLSQRAVSLAERDLDAAHDDALAARVTLANALCMPARFAEAQAVIAPALETARRRYVKQRPHPTLNFVERVHADVLLRNGQPAAAAELLQQVLADTRQLDVNDTDRVRVTLGVLANAEMGAGRFDAAATRLAEARALAEAAGERSGIGLAVLFERQAAVALLRGDDALASEAIARSQAISQALPQQNPAGLFSRELTRAAVLLQADRVEEAADLLEPPAGYRVLPIQEPRRQRLLAMAHRLRGRLDEAAAALARGLEALATTGPANALEQGLLHAEGAHMAACLGDSAASQAHAEAARAAWGAAGLDHPALHARLPFN